MQKYIPKSGTECSNTEQVLIVGLGCLLLIVWEHPQKKFGGCKLNTNLTTMTMIKIKSTLAIFSLFLFLNLGFAETTYASDAEETRKECISSCNEDYTGNTIFDGAQRAGCRLVCDISYLWAIATA